MAPFRSHPFDDDKLKEECGIFGVVGVADASNFVALGLHALQHRGQEAGGIVCYHPDHGFNSARRFGYVRDNFTKPDVMDTLPGSWPSAMSAIPPPGPRARPQSATCSRFSVSSRWAAAPLPTTAT